MNITYTHRVISSVALLNAIGLLTGIPPLPTKEAPI